MTISFIKNNKMKNKLFILSLGFIIGGITFSVFYVNSDYNNKSSQIQVKEIEEIPEKISSFTLTNNNNSTKNLDFTLAAEKTVNTVVHIKSEYAQNYQSDPLLDFFWGPNGSRGDRTQIATGSGVIISSDGYIVTNNHVIEDASAISVTLNDGRELIAECLGTDPNTDLALLKVNQKNLVYAEFGNSDNVKLGDWVLAVGNPFNLTSTVTAGIVSAKARNINILRRSSKESIFPLESFIQTDAAVNSGNSGGALVNTDGDLIGINTAITSGTGGFVGYSFAVPSNIARKVFEDIIEYGNVQKGLLGVTGFGLNSKSADELNLNLTEGFYINDVQTEMGAAKAGIVKGDVIISLDNIKIEKFSDLSGYLSTKRPGDIISVGLIRDTAKLNLNVVLEKNTNISFLGMQLRDMSIEELEEIDLSHGVKVSNNRNSSLYRMGIREGYILTEINSISIKKTDDLSLINSNTKINQMIFFSPEGEKERLIFE